MFEQLKQIQQIKKLHNALQEERVEIEKQGTKIVLNGKLEIEEVVLNPQLQKEDQEKVLKECFNEAIKKVQIKIAQKMANIM
ncbi:YbaB/EbfC family nucleoid-associated protein [bacterium]|nr:YbaB/EbfC family nucleoid-associated protein [bacterium]